MNGPRHGSRFSSSLVAAVLILSSGVAPAQTPPPDQPPPPADVAPPPPPPPPTTVGAPSVEGDAFPHMGKNREIMVSSDVWFRLGALIQFWADWQQSSTKV